MSPGKLKLQSLEAISGLNIAGNHVAIARPAVTHAGMADMCRPSPPMPIESATQAIFQSSAWNISLEDRDTDPAFSKAVVLVNDNEELAKFLRAQLAQFGYDLLWVPSVSGLRDTLDTFEINAILVDMGVPTAEADNIAWMKGVTSSSGKQCPIIVMTDHGGFEDRLAAVRCGSSGYLVKPIDMVDLLEALDHLTGQAASEPYRAMVIDDDEDFALLNSITLKSAGMESVYVCDPLKAVEKLQEFKPEVVLIDINMPGCSGPELARVLRQNMEFLQLPIVFFTGTVMPDLQSKLLDSDGDDLLEKTVSDEVLVDTLLLRARRFRERNSLIKRLSQGEARSRSVSETAHDAIISINEVGRIVAWNSGAKRLFGYAGADILGKDMKTLFPEQYHKSHFNLDEWHNSTAMSASNEAAAAQSSVELQARRADGEILPIDLSVSSWEQGARRYFTVVARDISERKAFEEKILNHRDDLQARVDEATGELREQADELAIALQHQQEVNTQQRDFVSMVSHEFRTPLAIIDGAAQRLTRAKGPLQREDVDNRAAKIRAAVKRMTGLIERTLTVAVVDSGTKKINYAECDIAALLNDVGDRYAEIGLEHDIVMNTTRLTDPVVADVEALDQVFTNLLSNAIKYSPGSDRIEIKAWSDNGKAFIAFRDYGLGIGADDMPRVFGRFFRAQTCAGIAGTGIGLHLSNDLVKMHDGEISVESVEGEGTTFTVMLPVGPQTNVEAMGNMLQRRKSDRQPAMAAQ